MLLPTLIAATLATPPALHQYESLALAPAGDRLAAVETLRRTGGDTVPRGPVVVRAAADGRVLARLDPCAHCRYAGLAWSVDGAALAFLATDEDGGKVRVELARLPRGAGPAHAAIRTLATLKGTASTVRWSPDGSQLAVLATASARKKSGALEAGAPLVGEIGRLTDEQRIAVLDPAAPALRFVSPADTYVYEYDWTPDGRGFVATAAKGDGDNNWWVAELDAIDLASGALRTLTRPREQAAMPRASPDGGHVLFIGGLMSDFGFTGGEIYEVPFAGGTAVSLTPGFRGSFTALSWRAGTLYASAIVVDRSAVLALGDGHSAPRTLWSAPVTAANAVAARAADGAVALSADGARAAVVVEDFGHAPAIYAGGLGELAPITHDNDALAVDLDVRSIQWQNEGFDVQGWLVGPAHAEPGRRYPMIVHVHGGPSSALMPEFGNANDFYTPAHDWVAHGYYLFLPNPRGSYGQGAAFTRANIRDFGGGDLRDILAGVDAVEKVAPVDDARLGLHGHSYGGFMAMWGVTHVQRFKAAVAGAGIANWISYYGQNGIDQWMIPFFGASAYDDPAIYRALSPIESIKSARTPTLMYVGELDVECPAVQSLEFWHGLKSLGVPTQLIIYPGEGHDIHAPAHIRDVRERVPAWFDRYLAAP